MQPALLPLFPLQVVLFPRTPLPLHVFEERYKEMIGEAIAGQSEFGVVLVKENGIVSTGCTATVEKVVKAYPDGRMDILVVGRRRFEVTMLNDEKEYLRGSVDFFDDESAEPAVPQDLQKALDGFNAMRKMVDEPLVTEPSLGDPQVSFQLAQIIPDLDVRQLLLGMRSEAERMKQLADYFPGLLVRQRQISQIKQVAPLNGHSHWPSSLLDQQ